LKRVALESAFNAYRKSEVISEPEFYSERVEENRDRLDFGIYTDAGTFAGLAEVFTRSEDAGIGEFKIALWHGRGSGLLFRAVVEVFDYTFAESGISTLYYWCTTGGQVDKISRKLFLRHYNESSLNGVRILAYEISAEAWDNGLKDSLAIRRNIKHERMQ